MTEIRVIYNIREGYDKNYHFETLYGEDVSDCLVQLADRNEIYLPEELLASLQNGEVLETIDYLTDEINLAFVQDVNEGTTYLDVIF